MRWYHVEPNMLPIMYKNRFHYQFLSNVLHRFFLFWIHSTRSIGWISFVEFIMFETKYAIFTSKNINYKTNVHVSGTYPYNGGCHRLLAKVGVIEFCAWVMFNECPETKQLTTLASYYLVSRCYCVINIMYFLRQM